MSQFLKFKIHFISFLILVGCNSETSLISNQESAKIPLETVISNLNINVVYPTTEKFKDATKTLSKQVQNFCQNITSKSDLTENERNKFIQDPRDAWKKAISLYHELEVMQYGPVKEPLSTTMQDLYTFDTNSKCRAEILISRKRMPNFSIVNEEDYKLIGLDTLEAFLFVGVKESQCARTLPWSQKSLIERQKDVCLYIVPVAENIENVAKKLASRWNPRRGDFNGQILVNGALGSPESAMNNISKALFYLYGGIIDFKVTVPAGIQVFNDRVTSCPKSSCPELTEHQKSGYSIQSILAALKGLRSLFFGISTNDGKDGLGFDDLLKAEGQEKIVDMMTSSLDQAELELKKHRGLIDITQLAQNIDQAKCALTTSKKRTVELCALNEDLKKVTNLLLQSEVILKGILTRPSSQQGDND